ncbi:hypothetical protein MSP8886_01420 [Marinomonas spartinae]|uniref:Uncharacterized protein n=1 Tax=Marinomonas spartinae TaxID=1792290 RepID=A0A1A8T9D1_9GAMM|nr:DUF1870 family protein [Marinomonas spartinae]SBS29058.1 hypothetical protein MSP8886_01420 [Marinomonas spartinae]
MSWSKLTAPELQAMRGLFFASTTEAAECIAGLGGKHPARSWQRWESGQHAIPDDIDTEIYALCSQRTECIDGIFDAEQESQKIKWYPTFEDFAVDFPTGNKVWWRLHQSVCAAIFSENSDAELLTDIETDKESYIYKFFARTREEDLEWARQEAKAKELGID